MEEEGGARAGERIKKYMTITSCEILSVMGLLLLELVIEEYIVSSTMWMFDRCINMIVCLSMHRAEKQQIQTARTTLHKA